MVQDGYRILIGGGEVLSYHGGGLRSYIGGEDLSYHGGGINSYHDTFVSGGI